MLRVADTDTARCRNRQKPTCRLGDLDRRRLLSPMVYRLSTHTHHYRHLCLCLVLRLADRELYNRGHGSSDDRMGIAGQRFQTPEIVSTVATALNVSPTLNDVPGIDAQASLDHE